MRAIGVVLGLAACTTAARTPRRTVAVETHSRALSVVPFGVGQFQNDQPRKGLAFAVAEGVTATTSAGIWFYLRGHYDHPIPSTDAAEISRARTLQQLEIGTGVAFLGFAAWGIVDAWVHFESQVTFAPAILDRGGGVALTWSR